MQETHTHTHTQYSMKPRHLEHHEAHNHTRTDRKHKPTNSIAKATTAYASSQMDVFRRAESEFQHGSIRKPQKRDFRIIIVFCCQFRMFLILSNSGVATFREFFEYDSILSITLLYSPITKRPHHLAHPHFFIHKRYVCLENY